MIEVPMFYLSFSFFPLSLFGFRVDLSMLPAAMRLENADASIDITQSGGSWYRGTSLINRSPPP